MKKQAVARLREIDMTGAPRISFSDSSPLYLVGMELSRTTYPGRLG